MICEPLPLHPPKAWFAKPDGLVRGQKMTVMRGEDGCPTGQVAGYVAPWNQCLIGGDPSKCFKAPRSPTGYAGAMQGDTFTAEGDVIPTANIGGGINHVPVYPGVWSSSMVDHYANTASQVMRVTYGEDEYGIWAAGALWPDVDETGIAKVAASALSGDWRFRPEFGLYDMVGSQMVSVPGFPLIRAIAASVHEEHPALVGGMGGVPHWYVEEAHVAEITITTDKGRSVVVQLPDEAPREAKVEAIVAAVVGPKTGCACGGTCSTCAPTGRVAASKGEKLGKVVGALLEDDDEEKDDGEPKGDMPPQLKQAQAEREAPAQKVDPKTGEAATDDAGNPVVNEPAKAGEPITDDEGKPVTDAEGEPMVHEGVAPNAPAGPDRVTEQRLAAVEVAVAAVEQMEARMADLEAGFVEQAEQLGNMAKWLAEAATEGLDEQLAELPPDEEAELPPVDPPAVAQPRMVTTSR